MRGYWENKSFSCCVCNVSLAQTKRRWYSGHVAEKSQTASRWLRVKSSPLGSRQGWQQPQQTLVLSGALCQVVPGQQTRVRQKAEAALCQQSVAEQAVLHSPGLPDPLCPWDRLHSPLCLRGRLGGDLPMAPLLLALVPTGTESCRGNGRTSPTHKVTAKIQLPKLCCKKKQ